MSIRLTAFLHSQQPILLHSLCQLCVHSNPKVEFALEGGVDTGGPRREFFQLLALGLRDGNYFTAGSQGSFFGCNTEGYRVRVVLGLLPTYYLPTTICM